MISGYAPFWLRRPPVQPLGVWGLWGPQSSKLLEDGEEGEGVEGEIDDSIDQPSCFVDNLAGDLDEGVEKLFELHLHHPLLKLGFLDEQPIPGFEIPGQCSNDHIGPIGQECIRGGVEGGHSILELLDRILLVASFIDKEHQFGVGDILVVGNVEEVLDFLGEEHVAFCDP